MSRRALLLASAGHRPLPGRPRGRPLALMQVANRALALHAMDMLWAAGVDELVVVAAPAIAGELSRVAPPASRKLVVVEEEREQPFGLGPDAQALLGGGPFLLHLGDSVCRGGLPAALRNWVPGSLDALVLMRPAGRRDRPSRTGVAHGGLVRTGWGFGSRSGRAHAGVYMLGAGAIDVSRIAGTRSTPEHTVEALVGRLVELGGRLSTTEVEQWWRYGERPDTLIEGNRFALEGLRRELPAPAPSGCEIQGGVVLDPSAQLRSSLIRGPAIVGRNARIADSYVGPYTSVGDDVVIEGAEVENSILLPGSVISHLGNRLEASVVGPNARLCRDFRLPKAFRMNVGEDAEVFLT